LLFSLAAFYMSVPVTAMVPVCDHYRIGEARNPGPFTVHFLDDSDGSIQEEDDPWMACEFCPDTDQGPPQDTTLKLQELLGPFPAVGGAATVADPVPGDAPVVEALMNDSKQVLSQSGVGRQNGYDREALSQKVMDNATYAPANPNQATSPGPPIKAGPGKNRARKNVRRVEGLKIENTNSTSWEALKARLSSSDADVIVAEEHHCLEHTIDERSTVAKSLGWKSTWSAALPTDPDNPYDARCSSGGVAIFVKKYLGLTQTKKGVVDELIQGRLLAGRISAPGLGSVVIYAAYLHTGLGLVGGNVDILDKIKCHNDCHNSPWVVAADWNMEPHVLGESGVCKALDAKLLYPQSATCISPACARTIDFFMVSSSLADAAEEPYTVDDAATRPHRPVMLVLKAGLKSARKTVFRPTKWLPTEAVIGPRREPQSFAAAAGLAKDARTALAEGKDDIGFKLYDEAFASWAVLAEVEVAGASDSLSPCSISRSTRPQRIQVPLVPEAAKPAGWKRSAQLSNLLQHVQEATAALLRAWKAGGHAWTEVSRLADALATRAKDGYDDIGVSVTSDVLDLCAKFRALAACGCEAVVGSQEEQSLWAPYSNCSCTAAAIRKSISGLLDQELRKDKQNVDAAWNTWKDDQLWGDASAAHRFSRAPRRWTPPEVFRSDGSRAATAEEILEVEAKKYVDLWLASSSGPPIRSCGNIPCERLTPARMRCVSRSYKRKTGVAPDGWHPRHYNLLSDEALECLADLLEIMEVTGHLPSQQRFVAIFLLDKPSGGTRPIGLFTAAYRLWSKARQGQAAEWAARNDRAFFAAGKGRCTTDPAWRHSVRNQISRAKGDEVAALCWDLRKFYETVSWARLREQAVKHGFPLTLVDITINAYRMARVVTYEGRPAADVYPSRGIVAGDSLSDVLVKLYYLETLDEFAVANPSVGLEVYFDDLQISARGPARLVQKTLPEAASNLKKCIEVDLQATLAIDKATLTASSQDLLCNLREAIGAPAGPVVEVAQFLGVDSQLGRCRRKVFRKSKLKQRISTVAARRPRLRRLRSGTGKGAVKIFTTGVLSAASYGAETMGISNKDLDVLQKAAADAMPPLPRGRSRSALFTAMGDPTWRVAVAPAIRWAQEVWAAESKSKSAATKISIPQLKAAWHVASKAWPKNWGGSRGAVDATHLSLKRIGWSFDGPLHYVTDRGAKIPLEDTSPKLLASMLREGVQRSWHRKFARSLTKAGWKGSRVCPGPVASLLRSTWASKNPKQAHAVLKAFTGATWTKERAAEAGYKIDDLTCALCGKARDTLQHRVCDCPMVDGIRRKHTDAFKFIKATAPNDPHRAFRGIWGHPADATPLPAESGGTVITWGDAVPPEDRDVGKLGGHYVFTDGSASRHPVSELRRAAWGLVFINPDESVQASVRGPVWRHLPQTPQAGEYLGTVAAIQMMKRPTRMVGDCLGVVNATRQLLASPDPGGVHGGLLRDAVRQNKAANVVDVSWMPSHQTLKDNATQNEAFMHAGNKRADTEAGDARQDAEAEAGTDRLLEAQAEADGIKKCLKAVGAVLAEWPPLARECGRLEAAPRGTLSVTHEWSYVNERRYWRCRACGTFCARSFEEGPPPKAPPCRPGRSTERAIEAMRLGHNLEEITIAGVPTVYCRSCGVHGSWQWRCLLKPCLCKPANAQAAAWLERAYHGVSPPLQQANLKKSAKARPRRSQVKAGLRPKKPPLPQNPLRNATTASAEDRARWMLIDATTTLTEAPTAGAGLSRNPVPSETPAPNQCLKKPLKTPHAALRSLLPPQYLDDDDEAEITCHICQAVVLASDDACSQCGLKRAISDPCIAQDLSTASAAADTAARASSPPMLEPALELLPPALEPGTMDTDDSDECPNCRMTVLMSDVRCAQCGLARAVATSSRPSAPASASRSATASPVVNGMLNPDLQQDAPVPTLRDADPTVQVTPPRTAPCRTDPPTKRQRLAKRTSLWASDPVSPCSAGDHDRTPMPAGSPGATVVDASHLLSEPRVRPWGEVLPWHGGTFAPPPPPLPVEASLKPPRTAMKKRVKSTPKRCKTVPKRAKPLVIGKFQVSARRAAPARAGSAVSSAATNELNSSTCVAVPTLAINDASDRRESFFSIPLVASPPVPSRLPSKAEARMQQLLERVRARERRGP